MPDLKVFLDDTLLMSTPVNFQQATPKRITPRRQSSVKRSVSFGPDQITTIEGRITKDDLRQVFDPEIDQRYYYIKNRKIKEGTYKGYAKELDNPYVMLKDDQTNNSIGDFVNAVYTYKTSGGKRRTRKSRRTNRRRRSKRRK
jgi:hypothetical protein